MKLNLLLVAFSLRNPFKDYSEFFIQLRGNALQWWHYIEQVCVVVTGLDAPEFSRRLVAHVETTDSVLVTRVIPHVFSGLLPREAWDWLNSVSERSF